MNEHREVEARIYTKPLMFAAGDEEKNWLSLHRSMLSGLLKGTCIIFCFKGESGSITNSAKSIYVSVCIS